MPFSEAGRNQALTGVQVDRVRLHSDDPGGSGTANALGSGIVAATFSAASSGERVLATDVNFTNLGASATVSHFSIWQDSGTVFLGGFEVTGDGTANAAGEYTLKATTTKLTAT